MPTYKTPDVYVEEISTLPPSVAEVETAIPAFIGYTEFATSLSGGNLLNVPTKLSSLLDFQTYFGGAPEIKLTDVLLDDNNNFVSATFTNNYYLYDSMQLFFDNGGGDCWVVSVGDYTSTIDRDALKSGIDTLRKIDEPTMLLFPDAAGLDATKLAAVQQQALTQCGDLKDRVCVFDLRSDDPNGSAFRDNIGINNLKYGAAYSPWLQVDYSKNVSYADVKGVIKKGAATVTLKSLTTDSSIKLAITNLDDALADVQTIDNQVTGAALLGATANSISARYSELLVAYQNNKTLPNMPLPNMQAIFGFLYKLADVAEAATGVTGASLQTDVKNAITNTLKDAFSTLIGNEEELDAKATGTYTPQFNITPPNSSGR